MGIKLASQYRVALKTTCLKHRLWQGLNSYILGLPRESICLTTIRCRIISFQWCYSSYLSLALLNFLPSVLSVLRDQLLISHCNRLAVPSEYHRHTSSSDFQHSVCHKCRLKGFLGIRCRIWTKNNIEILILYKRRELQFWPVVNWIDFSSVNRRNNLKEIFRPKRNKNGEWRRFYIEDIHSLYRSPIVRMIESRRLRYIGRMGDNTRPFKMLAVSL